MNKKSPHDDWEKCERLGHLERISNIFSKRKLLIIYFFSDFLKSQNYSQKWSHQAKMLEKLPNFDVCLLDTLSCATWFVLSSIISRKSARRIEYFKRRKIYKIRELSVCNLTPDKDVTRENWIMQASREAKRFSFLLPRSECQWRVH